MSTAFPSSGGAPHDASEGRLRSALSKAFVGVPEGAHEDLRAAICDFVRERRGAGDQPEEVVVAVKRIITVTDLRPIRTIERRELTDRIISWCISEYYRAD